MYLLNKCFVDKKSSSKCLNLSNSLDFLTFLCYTITKYVMRFAFEITTKANIIKGGG